MLLGRAAPPVPPLPINPASPPRPAGVVAVAAAPVPPLPNNQPPLPPAPPLTPGVPAAPLPINSRPVSARNGALITGFTRVPRGLVIQAWPSWFTGSTNNACAPPAADPAIDALVASAPANIAPAVVRVCTNRS
ncbi:hypothetical protein MSIMFB_01589 [Mycobacterium simulans]|uniref:Uncharacterized protein n=1 Tax=Mycobacterium simulans TaxID=627089 RepID=A0A7Z7IIP3_9MYCO|nr:hypothetical protein MSIMFB_01589 [Mycobacterium simulans]